MSVSAAGIAWRQVDRVLLGCTLGLAGLGAVLVASATWHYVDQPSLWGNSWLARQVAFLGLGLAAMLVCASIRPRVFYALTFPLYGCALLALVAVAVVGRGSEEYGVFAHRWVEVAGVQLQPSEPAKVGLILVLARVLSSGKLGLRALLASAALAAAAVLLVYSQPDLGTALAMMGIWVGMVVLAGAPKRYVAAIGVLALVSVPLLWVGMQEYMRQRVLTFLNPEAHALAEGYNLLQAQISIGSGGMWGKGLLEGTQTQLRYLRLSHSDFIFAVLGEELGFVGAVALLFLFLMLLFRILRAHEIADDRFAGLVCAGVACMITFQILTNIAGNIGLTPAVGIPLPLVSYGGSALVSQLAALGLVQGSLIARRPRVSGYG